MKKPSMDDSITFQLPIRSRNWWRLQEKKTSGYRVTQEMPAAWSGTVQDLLKLSIEDGALLWAVSRQNVMPRRLQLLCAIEVVKAFPQGRGRKPVIPAAGLENLMGYATGANSLAAIRNYGTPSLLHNAETGAGLWAMINHLSLMARRKGNATGARVFQAAVLRVIGRVLAQNVEA